MSDESEKCIDYQQDVEFQVVWPRSSLADRIRDFYRNLDEQQSADTAIDAASNHVDYAESWRACTTTPTSKTLFGEIASGRKRLPDVEAIVRDHLTSNRYAGLYSTSAGCGCKADDLAPCGHIGMDCKPGWFAPCPAECGEHDWHIVASKED